MISFVRHRLTNSIHACTSFFFFKFFFVVRVLKYVVPQERGMKRCLVKNISVGWMYRVSRGARASFDTARVRQRRV